MKNQIAKIFVIISLTVACAVTAAHARSVKTLKFHIPFNATVGKTSLPSGDYTVRVLDNSASKTVVMKSDDGQHKLAIGFLLPVNSRESSAKAKLVFNRYGNQYFLSQIWESGRETGQELTKTKAEREIAKSSQMAKSSQKRE
ncbi:MAG: hypothetical protein WKF30_12650, partial [Pyrinomonadaceae bacterium]